MPAPRRRCTPAELAFCAEYLQCLNPAEAVVRAKIPAADPRDVGTRLLRRGPVRRYLDRHLAKRVAGKQELLGELSEIATAPWRDFITVERDAEGNEVSVRLNLREKVAATKLLLQANGSLRDRLSIKVEGVLVRELDRMREPPKVLVAPGRSLAGQATGTTGGNGAGGKGRLALPPGPSDVLLQADTIDAEMVERETKELAKPRQDDEAGKEVEPKS